MTAGPLLERLAVVLLILVTGCGMAAESAPGDSASVGPGSPPPSSPPPGPGASEPPAEPEPIAETLAWPATPSPSGQTYYLSPSGNDTNAGTSPAAPWRTLRKAARTLHAGDTLLLRAGTYASDYFQPAYSGTREAPIVVKAYPGEVPVISGSPTYNTYFNIVSRSWIIIEELHFADTSAGVQLAATDASYLIIRHNTFRDHAGATMINIGASDHVLIEGNAFDTTGDPADAGSGDHIYLMGTTHSLVQNNYFTRAGHAVIDLINYGPAADQRYSKFNVIRHNTIEQHWGGGIYLIRGSHDNVVEHNRILYVGEGVTGYPKGGLQVAAERNIVRRNVVGWTSAAPFSNSGMSVYAYSFAGIAQHARHNRIYNNVVYRSGRSAIAMNQKDSSVNSQNKIVNNILYYNRVGGAYETYWPDGNYYLTVETYHAYADNKWGPFPNGNAFVRNIMLHADARGDHPGEDPFVYYDQDGWGHSLTWVQSSFPAGFRGNVEWNPRFADADRGDFRLRPDSPAIDAGEHLARTTAGGSGTRTVAVDDPYFFADGFGIVRGDLVRIGANPAVRIEAVDYAARTLTVSAPVSFGAGEPVDLDYAGAGPDIGATEQ